jgi:hypothetical protein
VFVWRGFVAFAATAATGRCTSLGEVWLRQRRAAGIAENRKNLLKPGDTSRTAAPDASSEARRRNDLVSAEFRGRRPREKKEGLYDDDPAAGRLDPARR